MNHYKAMVTVAIETMWLAAVVGLIVGFVCGLLIGGVI